MHKLRWHDNDHVESTRWHDDDYGESARRDHTVDTYDDDVSGDEHTGCDDDGRGDHDDGRGDHDDGTVHAAVEACSEAFEAEADVHSACQAEACGSDSAGVHAVAPQASQALTRPTDFAPSAARFVSQGRRPGGLACCAE